jgi:muramoyltetrapeptide carboxypeptidase
MIFPEKLKQGDKVAIIAPSSPVSKENADGCREAVISMGYQVVMGECAYKSVRGYAAGTGEEKAAEIMSMFTDESIKAIWCIRGGITSSHVVDKLDYEVIMNNPKIFVGYSDVTNLHVMLNQKSNLVTFHGPMVKSNMLNDYDDFTRKSFENALSFETELVLENPAGESFEVITSGIAEGTIVGGNLALLVSMLGTPYEINTKGKILFFEDVNEKLSRVDRMIYHLKYAGKLDDVRGIIVGDFTDCVLDDPKYGLKELLKDELGNLGIPVMYNIKSGHCFPMSTIPLGSVCKMDTDSKRIIFKK